MKGSGGDTIAFVSSKRWTRFLILLCASTKNRSDQSLHNL